MANERTITYDEMEVTVGPLTLRGVLLRDALLAAFPDQKEYRGGFMRCMMQTRSAKLLPFSVFKSIPDAETLQEAYQAFLDLPAEFASAWISATIDIDAPNGDKKKSD